jgi:hypothetical protein
MSDIHKYLKNMCCRALRRELVRVMRESDGYGLGVK